MKIPYLQCILFTSKNNGSQILLHTGKSPGKLLKTTDAWNSLPEILNELGIRYDLSNRVFFKPP